MPVLADGLEIDFVAAFVSRHEIKSVENTGANEIIKSARCLPRGAGHVAVCIL